MKVPVYRVVKDDDKINSLDKYGWGVFIMQPLIIAKEFRMRDGEHLKPIKEWLDDAINTTYDNRRFIVKKCGFKVDKIRQFDGKRKWRYYVSDYSPLFDWRIEFDYSSDEPVAYITFGPPELNVQSYMNKSLIDRYVPKEVIDSALAEGAFVVGEMEDGNQLPMA